ncbi:hypothetical protein Tco_0761423 [Tanacetum coccineum]
MSLVLPWGRTTRLDSGVRVSIHVLSENVTVYVCKMWSENRTLWGVRVSLGCQGIPIYRRFLVRGGFVTSVSLLSGRASAGLGLVSAHHILAATICLIGLGAHCDNMVLLDSGSATLPCSLYLPRSSVLPRPLHVWVDEAWLTWSVCGLSPSD